MRKKWSGRSDVARADTVCDGFDSFASRVDYEQLHERNENFADGEFKYNETDVKFHKSVA